MNMYFEQIILNLNLTLINLKHEIPECFRFNRLVAANKVCWMGKNLCSINIIGLEHYINNDAPFKILSNSQMLKLQLFIIFLWHCIISTKARPSTYWQVIDHMHAFTKFLVKLTWCFQEQFVVQNPWTDSFFHFDENLTDVEKYHGLKTSPAPLNHLIWKEGLHKVPSLGKQKCLVLKKLEWNWTS